MATFTYEKENFLLDGKKFYVYSGAIHYFRIASDCWYDRLLKLKECGFNTVETYIPWNLHEPEEGTFVFDGEVDICKFIDIAKEIGLKVILRPGPFICAEFDGGGLPYWLLRYEGIKLRANNEVFLQKVDVYFEKLFSVLDSKLIGNGGNVIMLQVENEYGSYSNEKEYIRNLTEIFKKYNKGCLLFYADGSEDFYLTGNEYPNYPVFGTFGSEVKARLDCLATYYKDQPLFCAEFWCGWFDHWYETHHVRGAESVAKEVDVFLQNKWGFNFYMFSGGTNFAFNNGANYHDGVYRPLVTSYDYNGLLSESGDRTPAYYRVRELFEKYEGNLPPITATESVKKGYGKVEFYEYAPLFDNLAVLGQRFDAINPMQMEELGQSSGYILYSTTFNGVYEGRMLSIDGLADRAIIYLDGKKAGVYERGREYENIAINTNKETKLSILVENCGRVNFGPFLEDRKGLCSVRIDQRYLTNWTMNTLPMYELSGLKMQELPKMLPQVPCFYKGKFFVEELGDTFLRVDGFEKGFVVVNGHNIGRYYTSAGPQKTLYIPSCWIREGENEIFIFESDGARELNAELVDTPDL